MDQKYFYWEAMKALGRLKVAAGEDEPVLSIDVLFGLLQNQIALLHQQSWTNESILSIINSCGIDLSLSQMVEADEKWSRARDQSNQEISASQKENVDRLISSNKENVRLRSLAETLSKLLMKNDDTAIDETQSEFLVIADSLPDMVWMVNSNIQVTYLNTRWNEYTGTPSGVGHDYEWHAFIHPSDMPAVMAKWAVCLQDNSFFEHEMRIRSADGTYNWFVVRGTPLLNKKNEAANWFGTCSNIQHRRAATEELERLVLERTSSLRKALSETKRSAEIKSQFVSTVTHEVRTPLSSIVGIAELMQMKPEPSEMDELVDRLSSSSAILMTTLNDMLDFSRLESGKVQVESVRFDPATLFKNTERLFLSECQNKGILLNSDIEKELPKIIRADEVKIRQILTNLISNAVKFTHDGSITVKAYVEPKTPSVMRITVTDTGVGIEPTAVRQIFEPFVQADGSITRKFGGSGLGLSICKRYVDLMGGNIGHTSGAARGSAFWFTFPFEQ